MSEFVATYRLQLTPDFDFEHARQQVPYLVELGISHLYLSPIWSARPGSTHGYDVTDPAQISEELGGEEQFMTLAGSGLGIVLDVVPNHMAACEFNQYWTDPDLRGRFFDIDPPAGHRRRFFDVDDLVGVKMEDFAVFDATHKKLFELVGTGMIDGVRIDHIDGLAYPKRYLERLTQRGVEHIWVEKILQIGEELRPWPVEGTTGYEFLNDLTALFVDPAGESTLTELCGEDRPFSDLANEAKREQAAQIFAPEVKWLRELFDTPNIAAALASLPVYRTYVDPSEGVVADADLVALQQLPEPVRSALSLQTPAPEEFVLRFQQTTGAVMAKGVEDTALYRYVRLLALNEVGGNPQRFGLSPNEFHNVNQRRLERFPRTLLASQTHDTKRSGDVRARITVLSAIAEQWSDAVASWHENSKSWRGGDAPDWTEELFIYQTLLGSWPISNDRLRTYLTKSFREAKRNTNWLAPNEMWEQQALGFAEQLCRDERFLQSFLPLLEQVSLAGERISLAQQVLRLSAPGVPDIYQGDETWNFSLVDPDNRRAVDWPGLRASLQALRSTRQVTRHNAKLFVTMAMLGLRHRHLESFLGDYVPLSTASSTCAYQRGEDVVVAVAFRDEPIDLEMPPGRWSNVLEQVDEVYTPRTLAVYERL